MMAREKQFIEDQEIRNEMDLYLKSFNYNDSQRKTIINLCEPGNLKETENGIDWSHELIDVLHEWDEVIGRPPYKAPPYKGQSEDKTAPKKSKGQYLPGGRGRSRVQTNFKVADYYSTAWERRENGSKKANERAEQEKRRKAVKGLF